MLCAKRPLCLVGCLVGALALGLGWLLWVTRGPRYEGPSTDHFDGRRFVNQVPVEHSFSALLRWQLTRELDAWPERIESVPGPPPPARVEGERLRVTRVGHATVLVQTAGLNLLTDPIWSERASPVSWAGPRRRRAPGLCFEDLPPIDVVVISHDHYDHLDLDTLARLEREHHPRFFVGLGQGALLARAGIEDAFELDWWQRAELGAGLALSAVPAQHFCARGPLGRDATLWCGWVLEAPGGAVFFAGDTGPGPHFEEIRERFGPPRLALLPIGAFLPRWFMADVHLGPPEALAAHVALGARHSLAIHYGTFPLGDDGPHRAADALRALLAARGDPGGFLLVEEGVGLEL